MTAPTPPGWYPDPGGTPALRWWDGTTWTAHTSAAAPPPPAFAPPIPGTQAQPAAQFPPAPGAIPPQAQPSGYQPVMPPTGYAPQQRSGWQQNEYAYYTFGVMAVYIFIAIATPFVFIGFLPFFTARVSARRGEPLAQPALGVAILGIVIGLVLFVHRFR